MAASNETRSSMSEDEEENIDYEKYLPHAARPFVRHYHEDFWVTTQFHPSLIRLLMSAGFLPIATQQDDRYYVLPKLHKERCVVHLNALHVSKTARKQSRKWKLTVNHAFQDVVSGCHAQHGEAWLYPPMVTLLHALKTRTSRDPLVKVVSIELYNEDGVLGAGELGYTVGGMYTSLTGFSAVDGAGTIQLLALGGLLQQQGFSLWDFGMDMPYKKRLGAIVMDRTTFLEHVRQLGSIPRTLDIYEPQNARTLIDGLSLSPNKV